MKKIKIGLLIAIIIFVLMFTFRLLYGYLKYDDDNFDKNDISINYSQSQSQTFSFIKQNIASKKIRYGSTVNKTQAISIDQKYEKIATIESQSSQIDDEEKKVRDLINENEAIIQYENCAGLKRLKNRTIKLAIGVPPEKFDKLVNELKKIGKTILLTIDKIDKTNEYKDLQVKKEALVKIRESLTNLKSKSGKIDEFISLENKIFEIEENIQKLGLSLGEFDSENEFCTVKISIYEIKPKEKIQFMSRTKIALEWTIKYYLALTAAIFFVVLIIFIVIAILARTKEISDAIKAKNKKNIV